jgi:hypothetical protein
MFALGTLKDYDYNSKILLIKYTVVTILKVENFKVLSSKLLNSLDNASLKAMFLKLPQKKTAVDTFTRVDNLRPLLAEYNAKNSVEGLLKIFHCLEEKRFEFIYSLSTDFKCPPLQNDYSEFLKVSVFN